MSTQPAITTSALTSGYQNVTALESVSLELDAGQIHVLLGANGSGKSTLFATLLGLKKPTRGTVNLFGMPPQQARRRNQVSYVPQHENIDTTFPITVEQVVAMGRYSHTGFTRKLRKDDQTHVDLAIEQVGLTQLRTRSIGQLSGGQRKRVFVARALAQHAPLILLDEPFAGVDIGSEEIIISVLQELRDAGTTILISTHHLEGVEAFSDNVILLHRRLIAVGRPREVLTSENFSKAFGQALIPGYSPTRISALTNED